VSAAGLPAPVYDISEEGPDHDKRFHATVLVDGEVRGSGSGRSKRVAEQAAAAEAARAFPPDA
jgi:ribonuclease III